MCEMFDPLDLLSDESHCHTFDRRDRSNDCLKWRKMSIHLNSSRKLERAVTSIFIHSEFQCCLISFSALCVCKGFSEVFLVKKLSHCDEGHFYALKITAIKRGIAGNSERIKAEAEVSNRNRLTNWKCCASTEWFVSPRRRY